MAEESNGSTAKTIQTVILIAGFMGSAFVAGVSYGGLTENSKRVDKVEKEYVRKDGQELEGLKGQLNQLNYKLDQLLEQKARSAR